MIFKRRDSRSWGRVIWEFIYPKGGFRRATLYVVHRMRRLPDTPHRVARGVFAGTFISFLPIPGAQFLGAGLFAWAIRGNILAALLATFLSNPLTTPWIAVGSIFLGHWLLGIDAPLTREMIGEAFAQFGSEIWHNIAAIFTHARVHWGGLGQFWSYIYWPYFVGTLLPAIASSILGYYITIPLVHAYQRARAAKLAERVEKRRRLKEALIGAGQRLRPKRKKEADDDPR